MISIRKILDRKIAVALSGLVAAVAVRTYQSMFNENTWDWAERD